jgi:hypothetical protein
MNKFHIYIGITISILLIGCEQNESKISDINSDTFDTNTATIELTRKAGFVGSLARYDVYINDTKQGTIDNGETKNIYFVPNDNGNTLILKIESTLIGIKAIIKSKPLFFKVKKGNIISINCDATKVKAETSTLSTFDACYLNKSISIEKMPISVQAQSETVKLPRGAVFKTKKSRTIDRSIELVQTNESNVKTNSSLLPSIQQDIQKLVNKKFGQSLKQSETIDQEITLDGNIHQEYKIVWYDKIRRGRINFIESGKTIQIPFQFREWSELRIEAVNP